MGIPAGSMYLLSHSVYSTHDGTAPQVPRIILPGVVHTEHVAVSFSNVVVQVDYIDQ